MQKYTFTPFPQLSTERLQLRALTIADQNEIFALHADAVNRRYIDKKPAESLTESYDFINRILDGIVRDEWIYWAICLPNNGEFIGTICIWNFDKKEAKADVGYELNPAFQGNGYMREALPKIIEYGFEKLGLNALEAYTHADNLGSRKLLEKSQFVCEKIFEEGYATQSGSYPMAVYVRRNK